MNAAGIAQRSTAGVAIEVVASTGSTNADLLARAASLEAPLLLLAEHQSAGRGRAGRSWLAAEGGALTFSLAWKFDAPLHTLAGLPLAVGVLLAETLCGLGVQVQLKWPNDVLKDGAKLAGVLIETQAAGGGGHWAIIGVGLNLLMPDALEQRIGRPAAGAPWLAQMEREALMATLLDALADGLRQFAHSGFGAFSARWNRLHAWAGQPVAVFDRERELQSGLAAGVDDSGALLLDSAGGRVAIVAGDISLRRQEP